MELNQRQTEILEQQGLSADFESLTEAQRNAIIAVEELLAYMETKYEMAFYYISYQQEDLLSDECLCCYPEGYTPSDRVMVYRSYEKGQVIYHDTYDLMAAGKLYTEKIRDILGKIIQGKETFAVSEVTLLDADYCDEDIIKKASALTRIFLSEEEFTVDMVKESAGRYCNYMADMHRGKSCVVRFFIVSKDVFEQLDDYTWDMTLDSEGYKYLLTCQFYADGSFSER